MLGGAGFDPSTSPQRLPIFTITPNDHLWLNPPTLCYLNSAFYSAPKPWRSGARTRFEFNIFLIADQCAQGMEQRARISRFIIF